MLLDAQALERTVAAIFAAAGCDASESACVARHLVDSNLCGHDSHGVIRVGRYIDFLKAGTVQAGRHMTVVLDAGAIAVVDGGLGFGQVIGEEAMDLLADKAAGTGLAMVAIRNVGHLGRLGDWAEQLGRRGLVSLHFLNTTGLGMMASPFGGTDRRLSICPLAMCVPVEGRPPVLLDISTTTVAEGKVAVARNKGEALPTDTIVDRQGRPTTDPNDFYAGGSILPIAGHKGHGLNILTDLLSGALSGGGCTAPGVTTLVNTMTSIAIDPARFTDRDAYVAEVRRYADWVVGSPPRDPGSPVRMPGEVEHLTREQRRRDGVPVDDATWAQIVAAGEKVGLDRSTLQPTAA